MKRLIHHVFKALRWLFLAAITYVLVNSSLDLYNNFAYDKAIMRDTPYGYTPLLEDPYDYHRSNGDVRSGQFVYVEDWQSADNGRVSFARVKSGLSSGYVNTDFLVETNINIMPIISVLLLSFIFVITFKRLYNKFNH